MRNALLAGLVVILGLVLLALGNAPSPEPAPSEPTWEPPSAGDVATQLANLPFDEFIDRSFEHYLLRFPQRITDYGFAERLGVRNNRLDDYSPSYLAETREIEKLIYDQFLRYDREQLTSDQQLTYDVCAWLWEDAVRGHAFPEHEYLLSSFYITSKDWATFDLLTAAHPLHSIEDVEDYISRLRGVEQQFDQLIVEATQRAQKGFLPPRVNLAQAVSNISGLVTASPRYHPFFTTLSAALPEIESYSVSERNAVLSLAESIIETSILPAYRRLYETLVDLRNQAPEEIGYAARPNGLAYYNYVLRGQNQTNLTAEEIHQLGLAQVDRISAEMKAEAANLGYADDLSIRSIYSRVASDGGTIPGSRIIATYEEILDRAKVDALHVFSALPSTDVIVTPDAVGGYYRPSNGSRPAEFAASVSGTQPYYSMPTLTYHETIPGHHLQIATAQELDLPLIRRTVTFLGFVEGWALYAERLAWELGWYTEDPYGNMGRLSDEMMRAVRLVVDTGIHAMGWEFVDAVNYFASNTGKSTSFARNQIQRYITWPGQSTAYMIGFLEILDLRKEMQARLGDGFDLLEFHDRVLENGSLPLDVLRSLLLEVES